MRSSPTSNGSLAAVGTAKGNQGDVVTVEIVSFNNCGPTRNAPKMPCCVYLAPSPGAVWLPNNWAITALGCKATLV
eukprot:m.149331 g.149331  ORF g.149331 m.149331 type:complete len:76 (-) comp23242_c0_seq1:341-568(-)